MKFIKSKKSLALLAGMIVAIVASVGAYAYFSTSGSGSNDSASVGSVTAGSLDVSVGNPSPGDDYFPTAADSANKVVNSYDVTVTNQDEAAEHTAQIKYTITTDKLGCSQADFSINGGTTGADSTVTFVHTLAPNSDDAPADQATDTATVQMIDTGSNQDACQGAVVTLHAAVS
jgi:hypothetical protein